MVHSFSLMPFLITFTEELFSPTTIYSWGRGACFHFCLLHLSFSGDNCQLGLLSSSPQVAVPTEVKGLQKMQIVDIRCGGSHTVSVTCTRMFWVCSHPNLFRIANGDVFAWGSNDVRAPRLRSFCFGLFGCFLLLLSRCRSVNCCVLRFALHRRVNWVTATVLISPHRA